MESSAQVLKGGEDALLHNARIIEILGELAERKRAEPGSDFTTALLQHPAGLDAEEVVMHLRLVLIAAHTTTSNLLARVLQRILTDTSRLSGLVSGELTVSAVVEEVMWDTPPLAVLPGRFATADLELGGIGSRKVTCSFSGSPRGMSILKFGLMRGCPCRATRRIWRSVRGRTSVRGRVSGRRFLRWEWMCCCTGCRGCGWGWRSRS